MKFTIHLTPSYDGKRWKGQIDRDGDLYSWKYYDYGSKTYIVKRNKNRLKRICVKRVEWLVKQAQKNNDKGWNTAKTEIITMDYKWIPGSKLVKEDN